MQRPRLWSIVVAGLVPVVLVLAAVRILLAPWFVRLEYQRPGFPPDPYGFSTAERLHWAE
ncbi:MAG: TIGR01906 family membrane protein, partial [Chloroflexi bacterium]|nr:TIGR01906 family membrane protein [Chloroflexota bacterium]